MARVPGYPNSASLGQSTMLRTIQCPSCGVVLNVPETAAGRRLKCPQCASKFSAPATLGPADSAIAEPSPASSLLPSRGPGSSGSVELPTRRGSSGSIELPTSPGALGDTFELPLLSDDVPKSGNAPARGVPLSDALALFQDEPKAARKPKGAEARARARRCPSCGGVVGVGMSLCNTCGLDLDTGQRVTPMEVFEEDMPVATHAPLPALGVLLVGSLCAAGYLILSLASLVAWHRGMEGAEFLLVVWLFGIFASVQFLRRKSMRPLFLALSLAVGVGVVYLIALPIYSANVTTSAVPASDNVLAGNDDPGNPHIKPITDQLDMASISWGIFSLLAYAGLAVYLNSPAMRREFKK